MKNIRKLTESDLNKKLEENRENLLKLRFNISGSNKRDSKSAKKLRREIAQILTEKKIRKTENK